MLDSTIHNSVIPISVDCNGYGAIYWLGTLSGREATGYALPYALLSYSLALYLCCLEDKLSGAIEKEWTER